MRINQYLATYAICIALLLTGFIALPLIETASAETEALEKNPTISAAKMDNETLGFIIEKLDPKAQGRPGYWQLQNRGIAAQVITDENANRMRIIVQVAAVEGLDQDLLFRLLQANFDTALDARYAIAQNILWSTFIHPLSSLSENEFVSGFAQTIILAETFGDSFSSGALKFNGGDIAIAEQELYRDILEQFKNSGLSI